MHLQTFGKLTKHIPIFAQPQTKIKYTNIGALRSDMLGSNNVLITPYLKKLWFSFRKALSQIQYLIQNWFLMGLWVLIGIAETHQSRLVLMTDFQTNVHFGTKWANIMFVSAILSMENQID